jgi:hypothetical protein
MRNAAVQQSLWGAVMTTVIGETSFEPGQQMAQIQMAAGKLINTLCDRSAYASDQEYQEILGLVRALRQFCGLKPS